MCRHQFIPHLLVANLLPGDPRWQLDPHFKKNKPLLKSLPLEEVEEIMNDPTWTKAIFFRDPAKRLLSAYLDKFVKNRDYSVTVFEEKRGRKLSYRDFVERVTNCTGDDGCGGPKRRYSPLGLHSRTNPHWKPHVYMCNLFKFLPAMNFVGSFDHLGNHTRALLGRLGLWEQYGASGWGKGGAEAMFQSNTVYHRSSDSAKAGHTDAVTEQAVRAAYWMDYAVMERLGIVRRDERPASLAESLLAESGVPESVTKGASQERCGPFGGTVGDGVNRKHGSWAALPRPRVVPAFKAVAEPVWGERWDLAELSEGLGPEYGP